MAFNRRSYAGGAIASALQSGITAGSLSISLTTSAGWPSGGASGPYIVTLNRGKANEEKALIDSLSGTTLTVNASGRGYDGTGAQSHAAGETIECTISAIDLDEANQVAVATIGAVQAKGDLWVGTGTQAIGRHAVGTDNQFLVADSSQTRGVKWGSIPTAAISHPAMFAAGVVNLSALAANSVDGTKIVDASVSTAELADGAVTPTKIPDASLGASKFATGVLPTIVSTTAPTSPAHGQPWWDDTNQRLFVWNGTVWRFIGGKSYYARAENNGLHDLTNNTWTIVALTETYDTDNMHSASDQFFSVPVTGIWNISIAADFQNTTTETTKGVGFNVGSTYSGGTEPTNAHTLAYQTAVSLTNNPRMMYTEEVPCNANDKITCAVFGDIVSGTPRVSYVRMTARLVGALT